MQDILKEPSVSVIGFAYSSALVHMFHLAFYNEIESGRAVKHSDFRSNEKISILKGIIHDFQKKDEMFGLWKEMENMRNELCYGYPDKAEIDAYIQKYYLIRKIIETESGIRFELNALEKMIEVSEK